jgi:hypothetical protein
MGDHDDRARVRAVDALAAVWATTGDSGQVLERSVASGTR